MDSLLFALCAVAPIIIVVLLGYFLRKINLVSKDTAKNLNKIVFRVLVPANLFLSVYKIESIKDVNPAFVLYAMAATLVLFALGVVTLRLATNEEKRKGVLLQAVFRSNYALIGVSLVEELFGGEGTGSAALLAAFIIPLYNVLAVIALTVLEPIGEGEQRRKIDVCKIVVGIFKNPLVLSILTALLMLGVREIFTSLDVGFRLSNITPVFSVIDMLSRSATPIALIALGAGFEFSAVKELRREIIWATVARLIFVPLLTIGIAVAFFNFTGHEYAAFIAAFASPVAVSSVPMAQEMKGDTELAGQIVVWTTIFSSVTLFLTIFILRLIGVLI